MHAHTYTHTLPLSFSLSLSATTAPKTFVINDSASTLQVENSDPNGEGLTSECVCVRVCMRVGVWECSRERERVRVWVCVCVRERERERERGSQKDDTHLNSGIRLDEIGEKVLDLYWFFAENSIWFNWKRFWALKTNDWHNSSMLQLLFAKSICCWYCCLSRAIDFFLLT